ncbi:hypothetical protein YC2023_069677 [Brassica napus]
MEVMRHPTPNKFGDAFDGPEMWASLTSNLQRTASNRSDVWLQSCRNWLKNYPEAAQMVSTAISFPSLFGCLISL